MKFRQPNGRTRLNGQPNGMSIDELVKRLASGKLCISVELHDHSMFRKEKFILHFVMQILIYLNHKREIWIIKRWRIGIYSCLVTRLCFFYYYFLLVYVCKNTSKKVILYSIAFEATIRGGTITPVHFETRWWVILGRAGLGRPVNRYPKIRLSV